MAAPADSAKGTLIAWEGQGMIAECHPQGALDTRQVARLRHDLLAALAHGCAGVIISGGALRYGGVEGLAQLAALLDDMRASYPWVPLWLCHLAPDLLAAIDLAGMGAQWHIAPDRATALDEMAEVATEVRDA